MNLCFPAFKNKMIDSHTHPQFPQYDADRGEVIKRTLDAGVKMICVGTDLEMSRKAVEVADAHDGIWASVGLHPNDNLDEVFDFESYRDLARNEKVVAIGEAGLDFYRTPEMEKREAQKNNFRQQLELAKEMGKPFIMHCREAYDEALEIWQEYKIPAVAHSFTGSVSLAEKLFDLGFYIGLNGIITFTEQYDEMVRNAPLDRILLETDAPFLAPVPYRGKRNESLYMEYVARKIAKLKGIYKEEVITRTEDNAINFFKLQ